MGPLLALAEAAAIMLVAGLVIVWVVRAVVDALGPSRADRTELARLQQLVDDLRELAWDHREIDPDLATIVLDKIRSSERRRDELP